MDYLLCVDDSLIVAMMQVSLNMRWSRISWVLILYFDLIPCFLLEVTHSVTIGWSGRFSKVIE